MTNENEKIIDLYQRYAVDWDRERGHSLFEKPWLDRMLTLTPPKGSILDMGCGSGEPIARYLIDRNYQVTGVDSSSSLVEMCIERFPGQDWLVADMRTLSLNRRFDGILAWDSFFHLSPDDQRPMFPIFRRHAASRAALMFTSGSSHGESIGIYKNEPLYHASLDGDEYRSLLDQNGFDVLLHVAKDSSCGDRTVWLARGR